MSNLSRVPIVITAYNRPRHLALLLSSLLANEDSTKHNIYVSIDGGQAAGDDLIRRDLISVVERFQKFFPKLELIQQERNLGFFRHFCALAESFLTNHDSTCIFLEDDLVLSPGYLDLMKSLIELYLGDSRVACVTGDTVMNRWKKNNFELLRLDRFGHNLGIAINGRTWKRVRDTNFSAKVLLEKILLEGESFAFDRNGSYPFTRKLIKEVTHPGRSWGIFWSAFCFVERLSTVMPSRAMLLHTGFDELASNFKFSTHDPLANSLYVAEVLFDAEVIPLLSLKNGEDFLGDYLLRHHDPSAIYILWQWLDKKLFYRQRVLGEING